MIIKGYGEIEVNDIKHDFHNHIHTENIAKFYMRGFRFRDGDSWTDSVKSKLYLGDIDDQYNRISTFASLNTDSPTLIDSVVFEDSIIKTYQIKVNHEVVTESLFTGMQYYPSQIKLSSVSFSDVGIPNFDVKPGDTIKITYNIQVSVPKDPYHLGTISDPDLGQIDLTLTTRDLLDISYCNGIRDDVTKFFFDIGGTTVSIKVNDQTGGIFTQDNFYNGDIMSLEYINNGTSSLTINKITIFSIGGFQEYLNGDTSSVMYTLHFSQSITLHPGGSFSLRTIIRPKTGLDVYASLRFRIADASNPSVNKPSASITILDQDRNEVYFGQTDDEGFVRVAGISIGEIIYVTADDGTDVSNEYVFFVSEYHNSFTLVV